jgi:hypothetical protein
VTKDGVTVEVSIIRLEGETGWSLEVVNAKNTSIVWDGLFATDEEACAEFERTVADEGIGAFLDSWEGDPVSPLMTGRLMNCASPRRTSAASREK